MKPTETKTDRRMTKWKNRSIKYKIANNLRTRINAAIRNKSRAGSAVRDLGCSIPELIAYLESLFEPGMTWENRGRDGWHIDHIIPLSYFDLSDKKQFIQACHYTNLQPLWAKDNILKSNRIIPGVAKNGKIPDDVKSEARKKCYKRNIKERNYRPKIDIEKLKYYHEQGLSSHKIAKEINISQTNVRYWAKKLRLIFVNNKTKEFRCKCGENEKENFYKGKRSICKKCQNKLSYEYQKIRRKNKV